MYIPLLTKVFLVVDCTDVMAYRCKCGVLLDKPWMERAHRCMYRDMQRESRGFWKKFVIVEGILMTFIAIVYLLGV